MEAMIKYLSIMFIGSAINGLAMVYLVNHGYISETFGFALMIIISLPIATIAVLGYNKAVAERLKKQQERLDAAAAQLDELMQSLQLLK